MTDHAGSMEIINWPRESREAAELVIRKYGEPDEVTRSMLVWNHPGPWKKIIAYREFERHNFPAPHIDAVESFVSYHVPPEKVTELALFDGSIVVDRTAGVMSARCHDEEANCLALNLADDIVHDRRTAGEAKEYYAWEFLSYRMKDPTPYMEGLHFSPEDGTADPDERFLSDAELEAAVEIGMRRGGS